MNVYQLRPRRGQETDPSAVRKKYVRSRALRLTDVERMRLRAALRNLRALYGSWSCLAEVMGVSTCSVERIANGHDVGSPAMALRAAKAAGSTLERVLAAPSDASVCPTCGTRRSA